MEQFHNTCLQNPHHRLRSGSAHGSRRPVAFQGTKNEARRATLPRRRPAPSLALSPSLPPAEPALIFIYIPLFRIPNHPGLMRKNVGTPSTSVSGQNCSGNYPNDTGRGSKVLFSQPQTNTVIHAPPRPQRSIPCRRYPKWRRIGGKPILHPANAPGSRIIASSHPNHSSHSVAWYSARRLGHCSNSNAPAGVRPPRKVPPLPPLPPPVLNP